MHVPFKQVARQPSDESGTERDKQGISARSLISDQLPPAQLTPRPVHAPTYEVPSSPPLNLSRNSCSSATSSMKPSLKYPPSPTKQLIHCSDLLSLNQFAHTPRPRRLWLPEQGDRGEGRLNGWAEGGRKGELGRKPGQLGPQRALSRGSEVSRRGPLACVTHWGCGWGGQRGDRKSPAPPRPLGVHQVVKLNPLQIEPSQVGFQVAGGLYVGSGANYSSITPDYRASERRAHLQASCA